MGINLVTFAAQTVTPQDDALIYEKALQMSGMIYGGTVTIKSANILHVAAGHGALCGRKFTIEATDVPVALTPSGSLLGRIYIHMDLSDTGQPITFMVETGNSLTPVIQQSDVNINNGVYEINLATFDVDTSTLSNVVNVAPFIQVAADSELSKTKTSPVQNKVITKALGDPETIGGAASKAYSKGDLLLAKDGQLYSVTANIAQGGTISNGGNVTSTGSVISQISNFTNRLTASGTPFYFDKKNNVYGWNSSPSRGADTFHPFSSFSFSRKQIIENLYPRISISCTAGKYYLICGINGFRINGSYENIDFYSHGTYQGLMCYWCIKASSTSFEVECTTSSNISAYVFEIT